MLNEVDVSPREEAIFLHRAIMEKGAAAANALAEFCRLLKEMRDSGLYRELGCALFEDYCINLAGIKARMAYNYISAYERLGDEYIREHAGLGITKLEVLSRMDEETRATVELSAADSSVAELKKLQEELSLSGRQVEMLSEELSGKKEEFEELERINCDISDSLETAKDEISRLSEELEAAQKALEEKERAGLSDEEEAALEKEIKEKLEAGNKKKISAEAKKIAEEEIKKATEKAAADRGRALAEVERLKAERQDAEERIRELEKKLRNSDSTVATAKAYLSAVQDNFNKLAVLISETEDETAKKLRAAALTVLGKCEAVINGD